MSRRVQFQHASSSGSGEWTSARMSPRHSILLRTRSFNPLHIQARKEQFQARGFIVGDQAIAQSGVPMEMIATIAGLSRFRLNGAIEADLAQIERYLIGIRAGEPPRIMEGASQPKPMDVKIKTTPKKAGIPMIKGRIPSQAQPVLGRAHTHYDVAPALIAKYGESQLTMGLKDLLRGVREGDYAIQRKGSLLIFTATNEDLTALRTEDKVNPLHFVIDLTEGQPFEGVDAEEAARHLYPLDYAKQQQTDGTWGEDLGLGEWDAAWGELTERLSQQFPVSYVQRSWKDILAHVLAGRTRERRGSATEARAAQARQDLEQFKHQFEPLWLLGDPPITGDIDLFTILGTADIWRSPAGEVVSINPNDPATFASLWYEFQNLETYYRGQTGVAQAAFDTLVNEEAVRKWINEVRLTGSGTIYEFYMAFRINQYLEHAQHECVRKAVSHLVQHGCETNNPGEPSSLDDPLLFYVDGVWVLTTSTEQVALFYLTEGIIPEYFVVAHPKWDMQYFAPVIEKQIACGQRELINLETLASYVQWKDHHHEPLSEEFIAWWEGQNVRLNRRVSNVTDTLAAERMHRFEGLLADLLQEARRVKQSGETWIALIEDTTPCAPERLQEKIQACVVAMKQWDKHRIKWSALKTHLIELLSAQGNRFSRENQALLEAVRNILVTWFRDDIDSSDKHPLWADLRTHLIHQWHPYLLDCVDQVQYVEGQITAWNHPLPASLQHNTFPAWIEEGVRVQTALLHLQTQYENIYRVLQTWDNHLSESIEVKPAEVKAATLLLEEHRAPAVVSTPKHTLQDQLAHIRQCVSVLTIAHHPDIYEGSEDSQRRIASFIAKELAGLQHRIASLNHHKTWLDETLLSTYTDYRQWCEVYEAEWRSLSSDIVHFTAYMGIAVIAGGVEEAEKVYEQCKVYQQVVLPSLALNRVAVVSDMGIKDANFDIEALYSLSAEWHAVGRWVLQHNWMLTRNAFLHQVSALRDACRILDFNALHAGLCHLFPDMAKLPACEKDPILMALVLQHQEQYVPEGMQTRAAEMQALVTECGDLLAYATWCQRNIKRLQTAALNPACEMHLIPWADPLRFLKMAALTTETFGHSFGFLYRGNTKDRESTLEMAPWNQNAWYALCDKVLQVLRDKLNQLPETAGDAYGALARYSDLLSSSLADRTTFDTVLGSFAESYHQLNGQLKYISMQCQLLLETGQLTLKKAQELKTRFSHCAESMKQILEDRMAIFKAQYREEKRDEKVLTKHITALTDLLAQDALDQETKDIVRLWMNVRALYYGRRDESRWAGNGKRYSHRLPCYQERSFQYAWLSYLLSLGDALGVPIAPEWYCESLLGHTERFEQERTERFFRKADHLFPPFSIEADQVKLVQMDEMPPIGSAVESVVMDEHPVSSNGFWRRLMGRKVSSEISVGVPADTLDETATTTARSSATSGYPG